MTSTKSAPEGPDLPGFGIARDLRQLKTHGTASVAELREFLAQTRGRRPQEVLGMVAGSHLMRSVALATVGALVILVVGSVVPWWLSGSSPGAKPAAKAATASPAATGAPAEAKPGKEPSAERLTPPAPATPDPLTAAAKPSPADTEKAVKVMGLGETKIADPKTNPLEKRLDDLLDKME
jgi:hypothetical protein